MKNLFTKNYNRFMKGIKEDLSKWRDFPCSWTESLNIANMATVIAKMMILYKITYRFNALSTKILMAFFVDMENLILNFT